ncbi:hypothetical protein PRIPAC_85061 [Pristionchus pacificus]|uniref:Uncharacterized protein n=1 Tax=Pristionchus pacificus TaxID=54126 RepID=A0A2A6BRZ2_PRIPA|nr:hypothetical protein PRIPAC_85061 [Pristionchus pacificus]|eukprot:PDM68637.1 hypothetical protein PRIPAC_46939 [Pristionchus pacificus]
MLLPSITRSLCNGRKSYIVKILLLIFIAYISLSIATKSKKIHEAFTDPLFNYKSEEVTFNYDLLSTTSEYVMSNWRVPISFAIFLHELENDPTTVRELVNKNVNGVLISTCRIDTLQFLSAMANVSDPEATRHVNVHVLFNIYQVYKDKQEHHTQFEVKMMMKRQAGEH